jgi:hypothetical protein
MAWSWAYERGALTDGLVERRAADEAHGIERLAVGPLARLVDAHDRGVIQPRRQAGLVLEAAVEMGVGHRVARHPVDARGRQELLDGHRAPEPPIPRSEGPPHPALSMGELLPLAVEAAVDDRQLGQVRARRARLDGRGWILFRRARLTRWRERRVQLHDLPAGRAGRDVLRGGGRARFAGCER